MNDVHERECRKCGHRWTHGGEKTQQIARRTHALVVTSSGRSVLLKVSARFAASF